MGKITLIGLTILFFSCTKNTIQAPQIIEDNIVSTEIVDLSVNPNLSTLVSEWNYSQTTKTTYTNSVTTYMSPSYTTPGKYIVNFILSGKSKQAIVNTWLQFNGERYFEMRSPDYLTLHYSFTVDSYNRISNLRGSETSALFRCLKTAYSRCFQQKACTILCSSSLLASLAGCGIGFGIGCIFVWMN